MDYSKFFSEESKKRKPSAIRQLQKLTFIPGMISLGGGLPHPSQFPFESLSFKVGGKEYEIDSELLSKGLQYSQTQGLQDLTQWITELQMKVHKPQIEYSVCLGNGSQDLLAKAFDMFLNPGDNLLIESPTYVGLLAKLRPMGVGFYEVDIDENGLVPSSLEKQIVASKAKVLYTVPVGGNPTGISTSLDRKKQIYELCQRYDLIIIEDDPYHYLQFEGYTPSYLSIDTDGRVLRFDSFSKILSAGARIGWVTGPKPLVDQLVLDCMSSSLHPSGISQILLASLLNAWGVDGFLEHVKKAADFYKTRRDLFVGFLEKHLKGICEWVVPNAGMFLWLKLPVEDSSDFVSTKAVEAKVLMVPGVEFYPNHRISPYCRCSFSMASEEQMEQAVLRIKSLLQNERQ